MESTYIVRGVTELGKEMFYTGKAGDKWVTTDRSAAFGYSDRDAAGRKALMFNRTTELHGLRFLAVSLVPSTEYDCCSCGRKTSKCICSL